MKKIVYAVAGIAALAMMGSANAGTLEDVEARGVLNCINIPGYWFSNQMIAVNGRASTLTVVQLRLQFSVTPTRSATYPPPVQTVSPC